MVRAARRKTAQRELAVDLDLLLGRVWSQFKGHNGEALALYDQLAEVCYCCHVAASSFVS